MATRFKVDINANTIEGPADYLESDAYRRCIDSINAGTNAVFNFGATQGHGTAQLVEVALQTDYAAWRGAQSLCAMARA